MTLSYRDIREAVEQKVRRATVDVLVSYLLSHSVHLGGHEQPKHFLRRTVYLQLYKDAYHIGFSELSKATKGWYKVNHKTLDRNIKNVRKGLNTWGRSQVTPGTTADWEKATKEVEIPRAVGETTLWIASTDCQIERRGEALKRHPLYSGKLKKVALRRMVITDGRRRIRFFSDGYTPKLYDSHWAKINKRILDESFSGGVFIGDTDFQSFEHETGLKCYTPITIPVGRTKKGNPLSQGQEEYNAKQRSVRAICEATLGEIKTKFKSLTTAWAESEHQQDYLFSIACGIHNVEL